MERDFSETQVLCRLVVNYDEMVTKEHALLNRIQNVTSEEERAKLAEKSKKQKYTATLLPIRTVGVQVRCTLNVDQVGWLTVDQAGGYTVPRLVIMACVCLG